MANVLKTKQPTNSGVCLMSNYEVRRHGKKWKVFELSTNQYVFSANNKWKAIQVEKNLQSGGGFNGHTPTFFKV